MGASFSVTGVTCASGYRGVTGSATVCGSADSEYTLSGCILEACVRPLVLTGYDLSDATENLEIASFRILGIQCAAGYHSSDGSGSNPTCSSAESCAEMGWGRGRGSDTVCGETDLPNCKPSTDWAQAHNTCVALDARMCTLPEIDNCETCGTGCGFDQFNW